MQLIIDRFEGEFAICEKPDRAMQKILLLKIPSGAKEGDVLNVEGDLITIDLAATEAKKKAATEHFRALRKQDSWKIG